MEKLDPQPTPEEELAKALEGQGEETGQGEQLEEGVPPEPTPAAISADEYEAIKERLQKAEDSHKEAHRTITRQAQQLAEIEKSQVAGQSEEIVTEDDYLTDPVGATQKIMREELAAVRKAEQNERRLERMMDKFSKDNDIPLERLDEVVQRLAVSMQDPEKLLQTVKTIHEAETARKTVQTLSQDAEDAARRNARAVTAEGGPAGGSTTTKSTSDMDVDELEAHLIRTLGVADR